MTMDTITFDGGTIPATLFWSGTPGTVVTRPDAGGSTTKALQFADIADDEETYFELFCSAGGGDNDVTVRYEVSSEEDFDFLRIYLDGDLGSPLLEVSGVGAGWQEFTVSLADGTHTLRFSYSKDSSADDGDDTAYISKITYPPGDRPVAGDNVLEDLTTSATGSTTIFPGYRFWKIAALATHSVSGDTGLGEVELRGSIGGADLTDTETGVASQDPAGGGDPSTCFDNNTANYWSGSVETASLLWTFSGLPQEVEQVLLDKGEMLDLEVLYSYDNITWATAALQRGLTGYSYTATTPITVDLTGANRHYDGFLGVNDLAQTNVFNVWCSPDFLAVTAHTTVNPIRIEKLIANSAAVYPTPPIGMTTYTFAIKGVIYADNAGYPGTLLAETAAKTSAPNGQWIELVLSAPLFVMPGTYWLGIHVGGDSGDFLMNNTVGGEACFTVARTYALGVPATFPGGGVDFASSRPGPIYAVYPISTGINALEDLVSNGGDTVTEVTGSAAEALAALVSAGAGLHGITGTAAEVLAALTSTASGALGFHHQICLEASVARMVYLLASRNVIELQASTGATKALSATWVPP